MLKKFFEGDKAKLIYKNTKTWKLNKKFDYKQIRSFTLFDFEFIKNSAYYLHFT